MENARIRMFLKTIARESSTLRLLRDDPDRIKQKFNLSDEELGALRSADLLRAGELGGAGGNGGSQLRSGTPGSDALAALDASGTITTHPPTLYWGTDSNNATCGSLPQNFYIGKFGEGTASSTSFFNTSAASVAGTASTYCFWLLRGPLGIPTGSTAYNWGVQQATAVINSRTSNAHASSVGGNTIFADIEPLIQHNADVERWETVAAGGKLTPAGTLSDRQQIVQGYLDTLAASSYQAGIYISPMYWQRYFGTAFKPTRAFVLWLTGCHTNSHTICAPCTSCTTTQSDVAKLVPGVFSTILGGSQAVLWQYWAGNSDFNVAIQAPSAGFTPVTSSTVYHSGC